MAIVHITIIMITEKSIINLLKRAFTITYSDIVSERRKSGHSSRYDDDDDDDEDDFDEYDYSGDDGQGRFSFEDIKVYEEIKRIKYLLHSGNQNSFKTINNM